MARGRRRFDGPLPIEDAIAAVAGRIPSRDLLGIAEIRGHWAEAAGEQLAAATEPTRIEAGRLTVAVPSSAWAGQIRLRSAEIVEELARRARTPVTSIEVVLRPS